MFDWIIHRDVRDTIASLDNHPEEWTQNFGTLDHKGGLSVWRHNRAYGVEILYRGSHIWGGVTLLSTFGLSPSHWALSNAIGRWQRRNASIADLLAG